MTHSTWRGHPIHWDSENWRFDDTNELAQSGFGKRPCLRCGKIFQGSNEGEPDACLGNLPGADNACCGHGDPKQAYIRFTNGVIIKEFIVERL